MFLIGLDTAVYCHDDYCGVNRHLIVHTRHLSLTYLVVFAGRIERLVPCSFISKLSDMGIHLQCAPYELIRLEPFTETKFAEVSLPDFGLSEFNYMVPISGGPAWTHLPLIHYNIPPDTFVISRQTQIEVKNGYGGQFIALIIDPDTQQISDLVFKRGHLWEHKREIVPAAAIERFEGDTIYLNINKADL